MDNNTIRVLSLDGGGVRGVISSTLLSLFCTAAKIPEDQINKYFDIITGTSIGGIQALAYTKGLTPTYFSSILTQEAKNIFNCNAPIGGQAAYGTWAAYLSGVYSSLYPQAPLKAVIDAQFGPDTINTYTTNVLVPAFQISTTDSSTQAITATNIPIYFSNISSSVIPYLTGQNELAANIALATSAAPIYFPPAVFNNDSYIDGGTFLNNPAALALAVQRAIKPVANRFCVLSIGTGLGKMGYIPGEPVAKLTAFKGAIDNLNTIKSVLDISLSIPPEGVSLEQKLISNYTLENLYYCRLQYPLDKTLYPDSTLDNSSADFITYMKNSANTYFNNNLDYINNFIDHFIL